MQSRTVALVSALSLAVGWGLGGSGQQDAGDRSGASADRGPRPLGVEQTIEPAPLTQQLRLKLDQQPQRPRPSRNPFTFSSRGAAPRATDRTPSAPVTLQPAAEVDDTPPPVQGPSFQLSGIAADGSPEAREYTAIISGGPELLFVKRGDPLPGGYVVADVQETMVTLKDSSGGERTLRLR